MTTSAHAAAPPSQDNLQLTVADLLPATGLCDQFDATILALCDTSFITPDVVSGSERFCHQLRHATNADTVYLCARESLQVLTTTSDSNDVNSEDTLAIHGALQAMVADLGNCDTPLQIPPLRIFADSGKLPISVIPVGDRRDILAVIVDADKNFQHLNQYCSDAVLAIYQCQTSATFEGFAPTTRQMQCHVFDALNLRYAPCSHGLTAQRLDMFIEDLAMVDIQFEKIMELKDGEMSVWGWQAVASHLANGLVPEDIVQTAKQWSQQFRTRLDIHLLKKAAYRYKDVCEAENLTRVSDIKPLCLSVSPQTLQQPEYTDSLRELTEKFVMHGARLVLEISEKVSLAGDSQFVEQPSELQQFAEKLQALRSEFEIRVALNEFGAGNSSLSRLMCLDPDIIKMDKSVSTAASQPVMALLEQFSVQSASKQAMPLEVILESRKTNDSARNGRIHSIVEIDELTSA